MFDSPTPVMRISALLRTHGVGRGSREVAARLAECIYSRQRYIVLARTIDGEVVAGDDQTTFFDVALRPDDAWCFDNYLRAAFRGGGRAGRFLCGLERLLWRRGYRRLLGYVDGRNVPARWTYETGGWRPLRTVEATYLLSLVGVSEGRLVVRNNERRAPATFPYRRIGDRSRRRVATSATTTGP